MPTERRLGIGEIEDALQTIAQWLIACYGPRIHMIALSLDGFYTALPEYYGIVPSIVRGEGETRETLPSREVRDLAEAVFTSMLPAAQFERGTSRDVQDVAWSRHVEAQEVTAHRRLELLARFGRPECLGGGGGPAR